jgi:hypothetical protein
MTITLEQQIEELRAEYRACLDAIERDAIWNELCEARAALSVAEANQPAPLPG